MRDMSTELIRDHLVAAETYSAYWDHREQRPADLGDEEIAYELLLHAGMHLRYSGDTHGIALLRQLPFEERERLAHAACSFLVAARHAEEAQRLAEDAMTDDAAGDEYEQYVYERDNIDVLLRMVTSIGGDVLSRSSEASSLFTQALDVQNALDTVLEEHIELTAMHAQTVLFLREHVVFQRDEPHAWWSARLERIRDRFYAPNDVDRFLERALAELGPVEHLVAQPISRKEVFADKLKPVIARVEGGAYKVQAWITEFRNQLLAVRLPGFQPALGGAGGAIEHLSFRVDDVARGVAPFHVSARVNEERNTLDMEFFGDEYGVGRLSWLPAATLLIRSVAQEERFSIDEKRGFVSATLKQVLPAPDTTFEIHDKEGARVCTLTLTLPEKDKPGN